jgi:hypothetical protein
MLRLAHKLERQAQAFEKRIISEVLAQPLFPLDPANAPGPVSGVYLLYYSGNHPRYERRAKEVPIYSGRSLPDVGDRIRTHCKSLDDVWDLERGDFQFRYLALPEFFVLGTEEALIKKYRPWWNLPEFSGFGTVGFGARYPMAQPTSWDFIHPGRLYRPDKVEIGALLCREKAFDRVVQPVLRVFEPFEEDAEEEEREIVVYEVFEPYEEEGSGEGSAETCKDPSPIWDVFNLFSGRRFVSH